MLHNLAIGSHAYGSYGGSAEQARELRLLHSYTGCLHVEVYSANVRSHHMVLRLSHEKSSSWPVVAGWTEQLPEQTWAALQNVPIIVEYAHRWPLIP